jgi:hypothetical protein
MQLALSFSNQKLLPAAMVLGYQAVGTGVCDPCVRRTSEHVLYTLHASLEQLKHLRPTLFKRAFLTQTILL